MQRAGQPYLLLRPPAVLSPLLSWVEVSASPAVSAEFDAWRESAPAAQIVVDGEAFAANAGFEPQAYYDLPERDHLLGFKWFAETTGASVAVYAAETFGGTTEVEWCWLFARASADRILFNAFDAGPDTLFEKSGSSPPTTTRYSPNDVIEALAQHVGVGAPGGCFQPHVRHFDWKPYLVTPRN
jgi:hypothetical protein